MTNELIMRSKKLDIKFFLLSLILTALLSQSITAQIGPALEMAPGDGNPTGNGPVLSTAIRLRNNTNNATNGTTFATYNPALIATYTLKDFEYPNFYTTAQRSTRQAVNIGGGSPIFVRQDFFGSPSENNFTSAGSIAGNGIHLTANSAVQLEILTTPLRLNGKTTNGKHKMADLEITFNRPVNNPIINIAGLGGTVTNLGFSAEFDVIVESATASPTYTKPSGSSTFLVTGNKITNGESRFKSDGTNGSFKINASEVTKITLKIFMRRDGRTSNTNNWAAQNTSTISGEVLNISLSVLESDLEILKNITPSQANSGENVVFNLTAKNNGPSNNTGVKVNDLLPSGYEYVSHVASSGTSYVSGSGIWTIGNLANSTSSNLAITAKVLSTGNYTNTATISGNVSDPNINNNTATASLTSLCFEEIMGSPFQWNIPNAGNQTTHSKTVIQPGTNAGFAFDIYELDNSFNMEINGILLATQEIEFQANDGLIQNIRFADGTIWEAGGIDDIWKLRGSTNKPIVRVVISPLGNVTMYGSKVSATNAAYDLEPLVLFGGNTFNTIAWNSVNNNTIKISQHLEGPTKMDGLGYGKNYRDCETFTLEKQGVFNDENGDGIAQPGETISYTLTVKNDGDIGIYNLKVNDPMLGGEITILPTGENNNNGILDTYEEWIYTVSYVIKQSDINSKGVYNLASVTGKNELNQDLDPETSVDPNPLFPGHPNYDPLRPNHTFVALKGRTLLITNPNIYQRVKRN